MEMRMLTTIYDGDEPQLTMITHSMVELLEINIVATKADCVGNDVNDNDGFSMTMINCDDQ